MVGPFTIIIYMEYHTPKEDVISLVLYVVAKYPNRILPIHIDTHIYIYIHCERTGGICKATCTGIQADAWL